MKHYLFGLALLFASGALIGCGDSEPPAPPAEVEDAETTSEAPEVELGEPVDSE